MKTNPKALYSYVKCKQKVKTSIPPLEKSDSSLTTSSQESANVLAAFSKTTFTNEDTSILLPLSKRLDHLYVHTYISEEIILHKQQNLKSYKSPGLDSLHAYVP